MPDDGDGGHQRPQLARHRQRRGAGDKPHGAESSQLVGGLKRENRADEKRNQGKNGSGPDANGHGLMNRALHAQPLALEGRNRDSVKRAAGQDRQVAEIGEPVEGRLTDCFRDRYEWHLMGRFVPPLRLIVLYASERFFFGVVHFKHSDQARQLEDFLGHAAQPEQGELEFQFPGDF